MITWRDSLDFFFRYFSLFSFTSLWKTLCKVKDLWGADLTPWTVSMKEGSPISHVTCCTIQMQIGSCNINCLNQFCKSCKFGGPGKRAAPIYIYTVRICHCIIVHNCTNWFFSKPLDPTIEEFACLWSVLQAMPFMPKSELQMIPDS